MSIDDETIEIKRKLEEADKTTVRVALFGQPGAGKSSIINKIVGEKVAEVGVETDKTIELAWYKAKELEFADLPGYGTKNFPKESYFQKFDMMQFDLFLCVTSGKFHQADTEFFQELKKRGKVCIFVANKHDELWEDDATTGKEVPIKDLEQRKLNDIIKHVGELVKVIFTSCRDNTGLDELIEEITNNLSAAKRERWTRGAKAYSLRFLQEKRESCETYIAIASGAAAMNAINPIPGVDVAVDISIIFGIFKAIRECYGLSDSELVSLAESTAPLMAQTANYVVQFATKEGVAIILKNYAVGETTKTITKYIPFVGQAIASGIGYLIVSNASKNYHDKCYQLAEQILKNSLRV